MLKLNQRIFQSTGILKYIVVFLLTVFLALALLIGAAFLPQGRILAHAVESVDLAYYDIENNFLFERSPAAQLDVGTDLMILRASLSTNDDYLGSVLTNPIYFYEGMTEWADNPAIFAGLAYDLPADHVWFYSRYWMGFRVLMRLALTFFHYGQIKRYLAFVFFTLYTAAVCSVSKHVNSRVAFWFALSIILVRPHVMATSMQFTACFLIAFLGMLLIPWISRHEKWEGLFFMEWGMMTMYFDFYTVPIVALGFPMLYLCILKREQSLGTSLRNMLRNVAAWFGGYGFMWIAKLLLTSALTTDNALEAGLHSFLSRLGFRKSAELEQYYSVEAAFEAVGEAVFSENTGKVVYLLALGILLASVACRLIRDRGSLRNFRDGVPYLVIAAMPFVWFVITKQPVAIHGYFQYRNIALTYWAAGVFLHFLLAKKEEPACIT